MSFNQRIKQIKRDNYSTKPVNLVKWTNPYLQLSKNEVYNKLLTQTTRTGNQAPTNPNTQIDNTGENTVDNTGENTVDNTDPANIINRNDQIIANNINNNNNKTLPRSDSPIQTNSEMENLARHIMQEVYTDPAERRDMEGYRLSKSLSTPEHAVYIGNRGKNILFGLRGTATLNDLVTDLQIFGKNYSRCALNGPFSKTDSLFSPQINKYLVPRQNINFI